MWEEKTTNPRKFQQTRYCRMSFVKKLPAVLIAAAGISLGFAGTALAETILLGEKTLGPQETLDLRPKDMRNTTLCFQTTDNLVGNLKLLYITDRGGGIDVKIEDLQASAKEQCISKSMGIYPVRIINMQRNRPEFSRSVRVRATQE
ncbi:hypothetical protein QUB75_10270 [Microcoleus sp. K1-B6]|uniref:hypothetical protein n=1 Tax=unclassified Microcoleus TaxID=2642155 RepID=UPI002FD69116